MQRRTERGLYRKVLGLKKDETLPDPMVPGLRYAARTTAQGIRVYAQLRYKHPVTGKWEVHGLGRVPSPAEVEGMQEVDAADLPPEAIGPAPAEVYAFRAIREKARKVAGLALSGVDPKSVAGPAGVTVEQAIEKHIKEPTRAKPLEAGTVDYYRKVGDLYLKPWLNVPLRRLDQSAVMKMYETLHEEHGRSVTVMTLRVLKAAWGTAQFHDSRLHDFPKLPRGALAGKAPKAGALKRSDLQKWFKEAKAVGGQRADVWLLGMMTGLRHSDLISIRREHIKGCVLTIPSPKGGRSRAFELPLSEEACELVQRVLRSHNNEWLFPSAKSESGHIEHPGPLEGEFSVPWTLHDLRRCYGAIAAVVGTNPYHLQLLMNHAPKANDVTAGYVGALEPEDLQPSQQAITDRLVKLGLRP